MKQIELVVVIPFAEFRAGERIADPALIDKHRDSPFVVKVAKPVAPADAPRPASPKPAEPAAAGPLAKPAGK